MMDYLTTESLKLPNIESAAAATDVNDVLKVVSSSLMIGRVHRISYYGMRKDMGNRVGNQQQATSKGAEKWHLIK